MKVRTRFAPSPTGELHLGNARTAVLNWAFARRHRGAFVLRFEDTDLDRSVEGAESRIREELDWLGLEPDEGPFRGGPYGPYRQSERLHLYRDHAERLLESGHAYRCYCTPEELEDRRRAAREAGEPPGYDGRCRDLDPREEAALRAEGREPSVRFRVAGGEVSFRDRVRGRISVAASDIGDPVILRSDGRPTYNFAVVVDDVLMEITHVIRGADHLANTPTQVLLYRAMGAETPEFVHVPLVRAPGGGGLSKREGAEALSAYREEGYHPDAVLNYLTLLAWSSPSGDEFLTRERVVSEVDLDRLGSSDTEVDPDKMRWLSGRHISAESDEVLADRLTSFLPGAGLELTDRECRALAEVLRERIHLFTEGVEAAREIFGPPDPGPEAREALEGAEARTVLECARRVLQELDGWSREALHEAVARARERSGATGPGFYHPLRAALTGVLEGPQLGDVLYLLGPSRTLVRLEAALGAHAGGGS